MDAAVWFLTSEAGEPLGQVYRNAGEAAPVAGEQLTDGVKWKKATIVRFEELRSTCGMRRFSVVVRIVT